MALVRPITGITIQNFIIARGNDPNDIIDIANYILALAIDTPGKIARITAITRAIVDQFIPEYTPLLHTILFYNQSSAAVTHAPFANQIVINDSNWIGQYLDATRGDIAIQLADRDRLIRALIDEYVGQYVGAADPHPPPVKDTRNDLVALLENCRVQGQSEFIQYALTTAANLIVQPIFYAVFIKYYNESNLLNLLVNGIIDSINLQKFGMLELFLRLVGDVPVVGAPGRIKLDRTTLDNGDAAAILALRRDAAYSLNPTNLALVLQPPNLAQVPALAPFLQAIRDEVANMTQASPFPAALIGIPGHYLELVAQQPTGKTLAEQAATVGNVAVMDALIAAGINVTSKPLMQIALTGEHYTIAQSLWNHDNNYPDPWFPPGFIVNDAKLARDTSAPYFYPWTEQFRNTFYTKYGIFNPGSLTGVGRSTVSRAAMAAAAALGIPTSRGPALSVADQQNTADSAIRMLNDMPDFVPDSGGKTTLNLLTFSSMRDELARITDPTVWDSKMLLPLIAKKGAVLDGTILPKADLLATGLALGADPNVADAAGSTALHYVAALPVRPLGPKETRLTTPRSILMLKTLLASPTLDVNKVNATGNTALHLIIQKVRPSVEHLTLLSRAPKLDYNVVDAVGNTALIHLIRQHPVGTPGVPSLNDLDDVVQILLKGSDMTVKDNTGHTALWNALNVTGDDLYLSKIVVALAKGLPDIAAETAVAISKTPLLDALTRPKLAGITATITAGVAPVFPAWLPAEYTAILSDNTIDPSITAPIFQTIRDLDFFLSGGPPSMSDNIMQYLSTSFLWTRARYVNNSTTFDVKFDDNTQLTLNTPYKAPYRALATTIYNPNGIPATASPADIASASRNNDALIKLVGRQYITAGNQRFLKKLLDELYYAQFNPSLGNDPLTVLLHLRSKMDSLMKYHSLAQKNAKQANLTKLGTTLTTFITNLISGLGLRFPTTVPAPMAFHPITFVGTSPHAAAFVAAAAAMGGIIPIVPGLRAGILVPPPRGGLRALGGLGLGGGGGGGGGVGGGGPPRVPAVLQNIFTGDLVDSAILATDYPTVVTLGPDDAMTYLPAPAGPIPIANGFGVSKTDTFYKFLTPFGLTAVVKGQGYILRPAELFIALFHQTPVQVATLMRDRNHPFVRLLRDYCLPAAIGLATHKAMPIIVTELNKLRGKLPV